MTTARIEPIEKTIPVNGINLHYVDWGSDGKPAPVRTESLRVAITVPEGPMPAGGWPVVLYAHGTGGSYLSFVSDGTASRLSVVQDRNRAELTRFAAT